MNTPYRLLLKQPHKTDFEPFYHINSDPETNLFNPYGPMDLEIAQSVYHSILQHWKDHQFGIWKIYEASHPNDVIGFGGISFKNYNTVKLLNLGFRFDTRAWGKGYATELGQRAIQFGFETLKHQEIFGLVRPTHKASINVLEKCGMTAFDTLEDVPNQAPSIVYKIAQKMV
jgi:RimJ/RimL family protein N-acetyltransferase